MYSAKQKQANQSIGTSLFTVYLAIFAGLMTLSFQNKLHVFDFENQDFHALVELTIFMEKHHNISYYLAIAYVIVIFGKVFITYF